MLLIGLTGSIATGKSHVARLFRAMGVPVFDADLTVHRLLRPRGAAVRAVVRCFPGAEAVDGSVDRRALGRIVFANAFELTRLESIIHPLVRRAELDFLRQAARRRDHMVVLDIPLLLETAGDRRVDRVVVVGCSKALQEQRALRRPGMTMKRLEQVRSQQMPMPTKRRLSDLYIPSGYDRGVVQRQLVGFLDELDGMGPSVWPDRYLKAVASGARRRHA